MALLWRIARLDLIHSTRTGALPVACLSMMLLLALSGWISHERQAAANAQRRAYQERVRTNWLEQPDRHPHRVAHYGYLVFRPSAPLSFLDPGIESYAGTSVFLEAHRQNTANFSEARQSSGLLRLGELSPALVLQLVVPLAVFFLGFSAIAREREGGTLAITLAQGVPWRTLLAGKALALALMALLTVVPGLALIALLGAGTGGIGGGTGVFARAALLALGYVAYLGTVTLAAVLVSARQRTSRAALTSLLLLWIALGVVLPRAAQTLGAMLAPAPSKSEFDAALERDLAREGDSHNPNDPHFATLKAATLRRYGVADVKQLPINYGALVMQEAEKISSGIFRRHYGSLLETFERQNRSVEWTAAVDPYLAIRSLSMGLAGSDLAHFVDFQWQAEDFRYAMVQRLNDLHLNEIRYVNDRAQRISQDHWQAFPAFEYQPAPLSAVLARHWLVLASLAGWLGLLLLALFFTPASPAA